MIKNSFLLFIFFYSISNLHCQDSVCFISKEIIPVKLIEIGVNDVQYVRLDNLNGPKYTVNKKEIKYIKFFNGQTDTIKAHAEPLKIKQYYRVEAIYVNKVSKITISNKLLFFENHFIKDKELGILIRQVPSKASKLKLISDFELMRNCKRNQYISWFGGIAIGLVAVQGIDVLTRSNNTSSQSPAVMGLGVATGLAFFGTGTGFAIFFKSKRFQKRNDIANQYNESL